MKKLFIILACLGVIFMVSDNLFATGGGGGGGGGGGDGSVQKNQPALFNQGKSDNIGKPGYDENGELLPGYDKNGKYNENDDYSSPFTRLKYGAFCFIDTVDQNSWLNELWNGVLDFILRP